MPNLGPRVHVYIDAFNLYYRCLQGSPYRWLDLSKLCGLLLSRKDVEHIRYFTALVKARSDDPSQAQRQQSLRALQTIPNLSIHRGLFLTKTVRRPLAHPEPGRPRTVEVLWTEEKGSDVNLATYLLLDGFREDYDTAVVISNDSDLAEPIRVVREELGRKVGVVIPDSDKRSTRRSALQADFYRRIRVGALKASQFPDTLTDAQGSLTKPSTW